MRSAVISAQCAWLACAWLLLSLSAPGEPETSTGRPGKPADKERREKAVREFVEKLPDEKRQRVLKALKEVWEDQDVKKARIGLREAAENYKRTMREAIEQTDSEVREIVTPLLTRLVKEGLAPHSLQEKKPGEGRIRFLRILGLNSGKMESLSPEERQIITGARDRILADARVKEALAHFEAAPQPGGRGPALRQLKKAAREAALEIDPRLGPILEKTSEAAPEPAN